MHFPSHVRREMTDEGAVAVRTISGAEHVQTH